MIRGRALQALSDALLQKWQERHPALRRSTGYPCWKKIAGKRCNHGANHDCIPRFMDHAEMWHDGKRQVMITAHPYFFPNDALLEFCSQHPEYGFRIGKQHESWYYPNSTYLVELWASAGRFETFSRLHRPHE